jgi:hypothetical protein
MTSTSTLAPTDDRPAPAELPARLWGKPDLREFYGVKPATLDKWLKEGIVPPGRRYGRFLRWNPRDIMRHAGL